MDAWEAPEATAVDACGQARLACPRKLAPLHEGTQFSVGLLGAFVIVEIDKTGRRVLVTRSRDGKTEVSAVEVAQLSDDPLTKKLEGTELETEIAPQPGGLLLRESSLTVLVEAALKGVELKAVER